MLCCATLGAFDHDTVLGGSVFSACHACLSSWFAVYTLGARVAVQHVCCSVFCLSAHAIKAWPLPDMHVSGQALSLCSPHHPPPQGRRLDSAGGHAYQLSDPALCSCSQRWGSTDCGQRALVTFFSCHSCGGLCEALGIASVRPGAAMG